MERKLSRVCKTLNRSPIQELSHLAQRCGAINLEKGFPGFSRPQDRRRRRHQLRSQPVPAYVQGICDLLASRMKQSHGLDINPLTDVVICCGQSEAFATTIFAIIDEGDEVLLFDPAYETYETCVSLAGGAPVYEYITFGTQKHKSLASIRDVQERTIITSSLSKTFSVTGWRIGCACTPANIASAIRNVHIKITDSAPAPFQDAALTALRSLPTYFVSLKADYETERDYIVQTLSALGFQIQFHPQGSVFVFAELPQTCRLSDVDFVSGLIKKARLYLAVDSSTQYVIVRSITTGLLGLLSARVLRLLLLLLIRYASLRTVMDFFG